MTISKIKAKYNKETLLPVQKYLIIFKIMYGMSLDWVEKRIHYSYKKLLIFKSKVVVIIRSSMLTANLLFRAKQNSFSTANIICNNNSAKWQGVNNKFQKQSYV